MKTPSSLPRLLLVLGMLAPAPPPARAQTVLHDLAGMETANATAWVGPLARGMARSMTTGFFVDGRGGAANGLGVRISRLPVVADARRFTPAAPASVAFRGATYADPFEPVAGRTSPTVSGAGPGLRLRPRGEYEAALRAAGEDPAAYALAFPDGRDLSAVEVAAVELTLGLGGRVTLAARASPTVDVDDALGEVSVFGGGLLVSLVEWLPLPVDLAVNGALQRLRAGDGLELTGSAVGLLASRRFGPVVVYANGLRTRGSAESRWRLRNPGDRPGRGPDGASRRFEVETDARWRVGLGGALFLPGLRVTVEALPGDGTAVSGGVAWLF